MLNERYFAKIAIALRRCARSKTDVSFRVMTDAMNALDELRKDQVVVNAYDLADACAKAYKYITQGGDKRQAEAALASAISKADYWEEAEKCK